MKPAKPVKASAVVTKMTFVGGPLDGQTIELPGEIRRGGPFYTSIVEWSLKTPSYKVSLKGDFLEYQEPKPKPNRKAKDGRDESQD